MTIDKGIIIRNIYYMLTYAFQDLRQNNYDDIAGEDFENILDLFAEILFRGISFQLKKGLHKDYIAQSDNLPTIRGKININESIQQKLLHKKLMGCTFDEFSENNIHNQILKSTLLLLTTSPEVKMVRRRKLRSLLLFFSNVENCNLKNIRWGQISYDRNSSTYRMLHHFCYFVIKRMLLTTENGTYRTKKFDEELMLRLFEKFVLSYYRKHYPQFSAKSAKLEWNIDADESTLSLIPDMKTDILLTFPANTLIIDTKYYSRTMQEYMGKISIRNNNLYQINSYVLHEDKNHSGHVDGMLLYAKTEEEVCPDGQMKLNDGNMLYFRNLDLNQDFGNIKHQLDSFISKYQ